MHAPTVDRHSAIGWSSIKSIPPLAGVQSSPMSRPINQISGISCTSSPFRHWLESKHVLDQGPSTKSPVSQTELTNGRHSAMTAGGSSKGSSRNRTRFAPSGPPITTRPMARTAGCRSSRIHDSGPSSNTSFIVRGHIHPASLQLILHSKQMHFQVHDIHHTRS
jgi:hypothetical protein